MPSVRITALPSLFERYTVALEPSLKSSETFCASQAASTWSTALRFGSVGCCRSTGARRCHRRPPRPRRQRPASWRSVSHGDEIGALGACGVPDLGRAGASAASSRQSRDGRLRGQRTDRRDAGQHRGAQAAGGARAASSASRAVASRRLATSAWQSRHPGRCASNVARSRRRVRRRRRHRTARAGTRSLSHPHRVSETDQTVPDSCLGRAHRKVEHGGDLRVRVALEIGQLQRFSLDLGERAPSPAGPFVPPSRPVRPRRSSRAPPSGCPGGTSCRGWCSPRPNGPGPPTLRCTSVRIHETALPLSASNRLAVRQISRNASWATSSAWAGSRTTRTANPKARAEVASYSWAKAASSPRPDSSAAQPGRGEPSLPPGCRRALQAPVQGSRRHRNWSGFTWNLSQIVLARAHRNRTCKVVRSIARTVRMGVPSGRVFRPSWARQGTRISVR